MIKFNKFNVVDTVTKVKARVMYSLDNRVDERLCVTLYAKDYENTLEVLFKYYFIDETDSQTDYFEKGRVELFEDHPAYKAARERAESLLN